MLTPLFQSMHILPNCNTPIIPKGLSLVQPYFLHFLSYFFTFVHGQAANRIQTPGTRLSSISFKQGMASWAPIFVTVMEAALAAKQQARRSVIPLYFP